MPGSLRDACVVVIGGSSGIGLATAKAAHQAGARVVIAGRDGKKVEAAKAEIGEGTQGAALDVADEAALAEFFASLDTIDHVANFAGTHVAGSVADTDTAVLREPVENRLWGRSTSA